MVGDFLKKVCILTSVHNVTDTRIFIKQAQSLDKAGYKVTLIAQNDKKEIKNGINIIPLNSPNNRFQRIFKTTFNLYQKALKVDADIYHFHDPELIPIGLLLKFNGSKVIYDVHEDVPKQILNKTWIWKPLRKIIANCVNNIEKLADKFLDGVISATPMIEKKFDNKNSILVQNFPLLSELTVINHENNNYDEKYNYITYIGGITVDRGIKEMIKAVDLIPDKYNIKFLLAGNFSSEKLKYEIQNLSGWRKVEFMGWINREEIADILRKSKLGLVLLKPLERYTVSYPVKMFEYMSASVTVLASNFPLWEKIIRHNNCGVNVDPTDPKEIAKSIQYLLDNPNKTIQMGENGRKAIEEKYNWSSEENKLLDLYSELIGSDLY